MNREGVPDSSIRGQAPDAKKNKKCPRCGSLHVVLAERSKVRNHCLICEHKWRDADPAMPWGYDVIIEVMKGMVASEEKRFHKQGSESRVRKWAALKTGFIRVVRLEPYTREEWIRVYGDGRIRM